MGLPHREDKIMTNLFAKIKKSINKYLERMAEENQKNFGGKRLDCCSIDKGNKPHLSKRNYH
jgi:hypothetical protein